MSQVITGIFQAIIDIFQAIIGIFLAIIGIFHWNLHFSHFPIYNNISQRILKLSLIFEIPIDFPSVVSLNNLAADFPKILFSY